MKTDIDIVIIGLNAAKTLPACIDSVRRARYDGGEITIYYADSGSTDDSRELAAAVPGVRVVAIRPDHPSPGAGRNAGWQAGHAPLVQFLDSDTELAADWFEKAVPLFADETIGAVRGLRREMRPEASVFNWIADREWNAEPGDCEDFGGDVLVRRSALERTCGYDETLVGGEDPELSRRVRGFGWRIVQLDELMTTHDLGMDCFSQYAKRAYRTGYGFAAVVDRHGAGQNDFWVRELMRIIVRGGGGMAFMLLGVLLVAIPGWGAVASLASIALGVGLILYPRVFRVNAFVRHLRLDVEDARTYAWHCAMVVLPEFFGAARYAWGKLTKRPLRNKRPVSTHVRPGLGELKPSSPVLSVALFVVACLLLTSCVSNGFKPGVMDVAALKEGKNFNVAGSFQAQSSKKATVFASESELETFSKSAPEIYHVGPGDVLEIQVRERPEISVKETTVSPDGKISVPQVGILDVRGKSIDDLTAAITEKLSAFYEDPEVTVHVHDYNNNKVYVLGRIANPGLIEFGGTGTLLEAIAMSGGLPTVAEEAFLSRAMIFRGKEEVIWVDLRELLQNGNVAMNPRLRNNDIVFIPESDDELVYVMGEVESPGAVRLKSELTVLDAIMASGGPTKDAKTSKTYLVRYENGQGIVQPIDIDRFVKQGDLRQDYLLKDGDIVFVSDRPLADINYVISALSPSVSYLNLAAVAATAL